MGRSACKRPFEPVVGMLADQIAPTSRPEHQAASGVTRISSKTRRNGGSGAEHMVRYVSRKASHFPDLPELAPVNCSSILADVVLMWVAIENCFYDL